MSQPNQPKVPSGASLRHLRNQAKDLRKSRLKLSSIERIRRHHPRFQESSDGDITNSDFSLTDAQLVIARELGFSSWPRLKRSIENESQHSLPMHQAVKLSGLDAVKRVYHQSPEAVHEQDQLGHQPLYTAALYRNQYAIDFLLAHGAACDVFACCYLGRCEQAQQLLLQNKALVNQRTKDGMTPLHYAARAGHLDVAKLLVKSGADANAQDNDGGTPILEACHSGPWKRAPAIDIIELLLVEGRARIDLHSAAAMGRADLVAQLLGEAPTIINNLNDLGQTALYLAAKNNHLDVVRQLVESGADVNLADAVGTAALHRTSQECSDELILFLIRSGAAAHLCCYVACGDEEGTRAELAANPAAATEVYYEYDAVGYAIHSWQLGTLRVLLQHGCELNSENQQHILRISGDQALLDELLSISDDNV